MACFNCYLVPIILSSSNTDALLASPVIGFLFLPIFGILFQVYPSLQARGSLAFGYNNLPLPFLPRVNWTAFPPLPLSFLEEKYIANKPFITDKELCRTIEFAFQKVKLDRTEIRHYEPILKVAINLPNIYKKIKHRTDAEIRGFVQSAFGDYTEGIDFHEAIVTVIRRYLCQQRIPYLHKDQRERVQVYFEGSYGVGKTRAAKEIAKFLNIPIAYLSLAQSSLEASSGDQRSFKPSAFATSLANPINPHTGKLAKRSYMNQILFFDEGDRETNGIASSVLRLLDPSNPPFYDHIIGTSLNIDSMMIIVCGNNPLDSGDRKLSVAIPLIAAGHDSSVSKPDLLYIVHLV